MAALARNAGEWNASVAREVSRWKNVFGDEVEAAVAEFPDFALMAAQAQN